MHKNQPAFTLIELLVVIVIIGILATVTTATFGNYKEQARQAKAMAFERNISSALWSEAVAVIDFDTDSNGNSTGTASGAFLDRSYQENHGAIIGNPSFVEGMGNGKALFFNGNDYILFGNPSEIQVQKGTLTAWIKISKSGAGSGHRGIIVKQGAFGLFIFNNVLEAYDWSGGNKSTGISMNDDKWHHVALEFDFVEEDLYRFYLDGEMVAERSINNISTHGNALVVGAGSTSGIQLINGTIDNVRLYTKKLSEVF